MKLINQIFDGLLELDSNLNPVPAIAREWSVSRDGLVYTVSLRNDVRFHNGRTVVAGDRRGSVHCLRRVG